MFPPLNVWLCSWREPMVALDKFRYAALLPFPSARRDLDSCLTDGYTVEYWECILGQHGCSITDMPCFNCEYRPTCFLFL